MNPILLTATSPHQCDVCAGPILIGERYYQHSIERWVPPETVRECASCAETAGRWT